MILELNRCIEVNNGISPSCCHCANFGDLGIPSLGDRTRQRVCQYCSRLGDEVPEECSVQLGSHEI